MEGEPAKSDAPRYKRQIAHRVRTEETRTAAQRDIEYEVLW